MPSGESVSSDGDGKLSSAPDGQRGKSACSGETVKPGGCEASAETAKPSPGDPAGASGESPMPVASDDLGTTSESGKPRRKKRRRAVMISRVDRETIEKGGVPSWDQIRPLEAPKYSKKSGSGSGGSRSGGSRSGGSRSGGSRSGGSRSGEVHESARDRAIREEKPPHW